MNRRELFALLAGAVAAPSELIVPERTIFLPPAGGWPVRPRWGDKTWAAASYHYSFGAPIAADDYEDLLLRASRAVSPELHQHTKWIVDFRQFRKRGRIEVIG
jgi:hypothetical protein